jgi:hypothetical protein
MKRYPYKILPSYTHLLAEDTLLWERFITSNPTYFDFVDYDIHVGRGMTIDPSWEPNIQKMATELSQFRIDAVGWKAETPTIIEIKPRASSKAIGQVLVYATLFESTFPKETPPKRLIITDWQHDDIEAVAFAHNIKIIIV